MQEFRKNVTKSLPSLLHLASTYASFPILETLGTLSTWIPAPSSMRFFLRLVCIICFTVWPSMFPGRGWSPPASSDVWFHCTYGEKHPNPRWNQRVPIRECSYGRWGCSFRRAAFLCPLYLKASPDLQSTWLLGLSCL